MTTTTTTSWPEGVIARYLTDAGKALADPTITVDLSEGDDHCTTGVCRGCGGTFAESPWVSRSLDIGKRWAQEHAETCRAMPRPSEGS